MERLQNLFQKYLNNNISADEYAEMWQLMDTEEQSEKLTTLMLNLWQENPKHTLKDNDWDDKIRLLKSSIQPLKQKRTSFWKYVAAASIIVALGSGLYVALISKNKSGNSEISINGVAANDVQAPQTNRAMITLADGRQVYLDSISSGKVAQEGNINLVKLPDGQIVYETANGDALKVMQYNTLHNPAGSKVIDIQLNEGSHIWLNAGSSITYPVAFIGKERKIEISGEAYFEIAKDPSKPFKISAAGKAEVEVLGTHFNINSYSDEAIIKTTLLEGSVKITAAVSNKSHVLKPREQARIHHTGQFSVNKNVDVEEVMAWKNGKFIFQGLDIQSIMRQISKWYDVDVEYKGAITKEEFVGIISRNVNISEIIKMLEKTGAVHFEIEGRKIIVK